ncbi:peptide chain release factor N(5)-glutamine methyltransferase [Patescibacteria group bacterium]|nr:peptide chain release factor N(5)-glutamine methyltransferase [Patescibacteria group bacterium]
MNLKQALSWATYKLQAKNINSAKLDAEILLSFVLKKDKTFLYSHPEQTISHKPLAIYRKLINQRSENYPVAYLTGEKEFYGYKFFVNKNVLIPRPLTEELVEKALQTINRLIKHPNKQITIADIGTGSGCIIISLANELKKKYGSLKNFKFYATDISAKALKVAKKNARFHQVDKSIKFFQGDLLKPLKSKKIDLIIANLPYLNLKDIQKEKSIQFEPKKALYSKDNGHLIYQKLFHQAEKSYSNSIIIYENKQGIHVRINY